MRTLLIGDSLLSMSSSELKSADIHDVTNINSSLVFAESNSNLFDPITIQPVFPPIEITTLPVGEPVAESVVATPQITEVLSEPEIEIEIDPFDLNRDGMISALDADLIMAALDDPTSLSDDDQDRFDLNGDGFLTARDALQVVNRQS